MRNRHFEMEYYETYYYSNIVHGLIRDPAPYLRSLEDFFGDFRYQSFVSPYPQSSNLHRFINFVLDTDLSESIDDVMEDALVHKPNYRIWIEPALDTYQIPFIGFKEWLISHSLELSQMNRDTIFDFLSFLEKSGTISSLFERISGEVFFILFLNRGFLKEFNSMVSYRISEALVSEQPNEIARLFNKNGVLERARPPVWARKAVYYRDRGRCVICHKDLSGILSLESAEHFDHIIPLSSGGANDVTNLQLLCSECNLSKGGRSTETSITYESWY